MKLVFGLPWYSSRDEYDAPPLHELAEDAFDAVLQNVSWPATADERARWRELLANVTR